MNHQEFLAKRKKGIGGSDVAGILGLSKWATPLSVYLDKTGQSEPIKDNDPMKWGRILEDPIAKQFETESGLRVRNCNRVLYHKDHSFLLANIDRKISGEHTGLEVKTANSFKVSEWDNAVPDAYMLQCQHYMCVTGWNKWHLAVLIGGNTFRWFEIDRDNELIDNVLIPQLTDFWVNNVQAGVPPDATNSSIDKQSLSILYRDIDDSKKMEFDSDLSDIVKQYRYLKEAEKRNKDEQTGLYNQIVSNMGECVLATSPGYKILWNPVNRKSLDTTRLKTERPEIFQQYQKQTQSRTLRISELKEN